MKPIASLSSITLKTPRLEAMAEFYSSAFGLAALATSEDSVALAGKDGDRPHLVLQRARQRALGGLGFALRSQSDVDLSAAELERAGVKTTAHSGGSGSDGGFAVIDPDGTPLHFAVGAAARAASVEDNDRPLFLSHVVLNTQDAPRLIAFFTNTLGLAVADAYEDGLLTFLRCDQPQHHCVGVSPGQTAGLNHFAMDCGGLDALMRSVGRMQRLGHAPVWGPGRHAPGGNIFCYYQDPDGFVAEFTCDLLQIEDATRWRPKEWARTPANGNVWGTGGPTPRAVELMSGAG